jgi:hypothetical protein
MEIRRIHNRHGSSRTLRLEYSSEQPKTALAHLFAERR